MLSRRALFGLQPRNGGPVLLCFFIAALPGILLFASVALSQSIDKKGIGLLDSVTITLKKQPFIHLQEQDVEASHGRLQQESGRFDTSLGATLGHDRRDIPLTDLERQSLPGSASQLTETSTTKIDLRKEFRTGVSVTPSIGVTRTNTAPGPAQPANAGTVNFMISVPLLKGLGTGAAGANELAARRDMEASILTLRRTLSQQVLTTVSSYWDYLAALRILEQRSASEARAERSYSETKQLIEGDERAAADIERVAANLAVKAAARLEAEQSLFRAKHALGLAMGLPFEEIESLPLPVDDFPRAGAQNINKINTAAALKLFTDQSLKHRTDYLASEKAQESAQILVEQARNNLLPQLDFQVGLGYSGLKEGADVLSFSAAPIDNIPGYSALASLTYRWPYKNNTARGLLLQATAAYRKTVIAADDLGRNIKSSVSQNISDLSKTALELAKYYDAADHYRKAVENEREKFLLGMSTLSDLLTTEDNLIAALINLISAESAHAKALARLRFETGTLLAYGQERISVGIEELTSVPFIEESEGSKSD